MIRGIDLSVHNTLNPQLVANLQWANGLYFAFIKASEGVTVQDAKFESNWAMCRQAGLLCGAYHFLRPLSDPAQQALNFIGQYQKVNTTAAIPPVVDIEWALDANKKDQWAAISLPQRIALIKTFLAAVEAGLNVKPMIYTAYSFWKSMVVTQPSSADSAFFAQHPLWIVDLSNSGKVPPPWTSALFVQDYFGDQTADPANMYARLDHDHYNGSLLQLLAMAGPGYVIDKTFPRSTLVKDLQNALASRNVSPGTADGWFGAMTEKAVKTFQTSLGLAATGVVDAATWNKLL